MYSRLPALMMINEERLRELYAAGEIDLAQLERSLDIINRRRLAADSPRPVGRASEPLKPEEKERLLDRALAAPKQPRQPVRMCPQCRSPLSRAREQEMVAWCARCGEDVSYAPQRAEQPACDDRGGWAVGGIVVLPPGGLDVF